MTIKEQVLNKCIHFNGFQHEKCKANVLYESVTDRSNLIRKNPCLKKSIFSGDGVSCDKIQFPSEDEAEKMVNEIQGNSGKSIKALIAVKKHYKETGETSGKIKCPNCSGALRFAVAESNGHTRGECKSCEISWIE